MKRKMIVILICVLFLATGFASASTTFENNNQKSIEEDRGNRLFVFGRMEQIDFAGNYVDFRIISFVLIKDGKDIYKLNNDEIIRFYAPMIGFLINKIVIGFFSYKEIIK